MMISLHYFGRAAITVLQPFVLLPYPWTELTKIIFFEPDDELGRPIDANALLDLPSSELESYLHEFLDLIWRSSNYPLNLHC
jgi:hypothetical protein